MKTQWSSQQRRSAAVGALLLGFALAGCQGGAASEPEPSYWPTEGWQTTTPEAQGFHSAKLAEGLLAIQENGTPVHSLMLIRDGYVLLDSTFYPYDGSTVHDLASDTKSVMTTLIGIAADQGLLDLDAPLVSFFPDRTIANLDAQKESVTVRHLVSLTSGLKCDPQGDEQDLADMWASENWVQFALDRPSVAAPGKRFVYCGPDMHLLSAIVQQATGMTALEFARQNLFESLGIHDVVWSADPQGTTRGWGDLALYPADAAKLGLLFLQQGRWDDRQVVSREWVAEATKAQAQTGPYRSEDYGYGWWVSRQDEEVPYFSASGRGGQYIRVFPGLNAIVATTGGGFDNAGDVTDYLGAAIGDMENPLPDNAAGVALLEAAEAAVSLPPAAKVVPPLPEAAKLISGQTYVLESNPLQIESLRLNFDDGNQAILDVQIGGEDEPRRITVGLDGVYRMSPGNEGLLQGARGGWTNPNTFVIDYNEVANIDDWTFQAIFQGQDLLLLVFGPTSVKVEGSAK